MPNSYKESKPTGICEEASSPAGLAGEKIEKEGAEEVRW